MEILKDFSSTTSIAPIPAIGRSKRCPAKLLWTGIFIFSLGMLTYQTVLMIQRFLEYPKSISFEIKPKSATFPWITLCNAETMSYRMLVAGMPAYGEKEDSQLYRDITKKLANLTDEMLVPYRYYHHSHKNDPDKEKAYMTYLDIIFDIASVLWDPSVIMAPYIGMHQRFGIELDQLVALCMFQNRPCDFTDFYPVYDPKFSNCFTYKPNNRTSTIKEQLGLTLVAFSAAGVVNPFHHILEYLDMLFEKAQKGRFSKVIDQRSTKVYIHPPNTKPGSYRESIDIGPGQFTTIQIKESIVKRITTPKEKCQEDKTTRWEGVDYDETFSDCQRQCVFDYIKEKCNCDLQEVIFGMDDPSNATKCYPDLSNNFSNLMKNYFDNPMSKNIELLNQLQEDMCATRALVEASDIECDCHLPCIDRKYATSVSSVRWPKDLPKGKAFLFGTLDNIFTTADFASKFTEDELDAMDTFSGIPFKNITEDMKLFRDFGDLGTKLLSHFSVVDIYYTSTDVENFVENRDYILRNLCSDFGGLLGLWVGISAVTAFEVLELVFHICMACCHVTKAKSRGDIVKGNPMMHSSVCTIVIEK